LIEDDQRRNHRKGAASGTLFIDDGIDVQL